MTKFRNLGIIFSLFILCTLTSCNDDEDGSEAALVGPATISETIGKNGVVTSLNAALSAAAGDLPGTLNGSGPFTVFAPNDAAFETFATEVGFEANDDETAAAQLLAAADANLLAQILTYHVVTGSLEATDFSDGQTLTTVEGGTLSVIVGDDVQLLDATDLPQTNPVATVVQADGFASNGIIHVIDKVLLPEGAIEALNIDTRPSIAEWAAGTEDLSLLTSALEKAGLLEAVVGLDTARVLAPNNDAFGDLLNALGDDYNSLDDFDNEAEIALLGDILKYHVLTPVDSSIELMAGPAPTLLEDSTVEVIADGGGGFSFGDATAANATTVTAGIDARNGAVDIIDKVLLPQAALDFLDLLASDDLASIVVETPALSVLEEALIATDLVGAFIDATNGAMDSTATNFTYFRPATVFAPSDAAFLDLLDALGPDYTSIASFDTEEELELLSTILLYHVVSGQIVSEDLAAGMVTTLSESDIEIISVVGTDGFVIGDATNDVNANIVAADILARNGVAHLIDKVLLPQVAIDFIDSLDD
ncbi:fasciclin domain-containing protein [Aggregatimonas sangjinii]|uniref:Fasciclin domain-containing protein n=1 Tax=Aggregatimonas sangjinii TaxID=2583587 RepID=A0A5B7SRI0_9FLAO|nr:fasciclin domain-containing protein [Aggregatimonas sangjinii]QCW99632.1 fasciclin domain-containing protein [Aggregatimonas sangjinii]